MKLTLGMTAIALLCAPAASQAPFDPSEGQSIPWEDITWTSGTITRMVSGDFTGDLYQDVVLLDGSQLVLVFAPAVFEARSSLGDSGVVDFCAVPGPSGVDGLVASDAYGWRNIWVNYAEGDRVGSVAFPDEDWVNAKSLQPYIPAGVNVPAKVVALDQYGERILCISNPFVNPQADVIATLEDVGLALAVVDWDGEGDPEVAVLLDTGLDIYEFGSSTPISYSLPASNPGPLSGGALVGFRAAGDERLAALLLGSEEQLWIVDSSGAGTPSTVNVGNPYALAAGDVDGGGTDEIVVAHSDENVDGPLFYSCTGTGGPGGSCSFGTPEVLSIGIEDLSQQASFPVLDDFTGDGDVDLAWFFESVAPELRVAENTSTNHADLFVGVQEGPTRVHLDGTDPGGRIGQVKVYFAAPPEEEEYWFEPDSILVEEWYQNNEILLQPVGAQAFLVDYPNEASESWGTYHELFFWPNWMPVDGVYHLTIRAVDYDNVGNTILKAGPAKLYSVAVTVGAVDYLNTICTKFPLVTIGRDLTSPTAPPGYPSFPSGEFFGNSFTGAGGGTPPKPPPMGTALPPKAPKIN